LRSSASSDTVKTVVTGHRNVPQAPRRRSGWRQRGYAPPWHRRRTTSSAVRSSPSPESITPHKKFKAEIYVLSKDEGGRHTPFFNDYRPQFYFRTTDVTGIVDLAEGR